MQPNRRMRTYQYDLHWSARRRDGGEADDVTEVNCYQFVTLGQHRLVCLEIFGDGRWQQLAQQTHCTFRILGYVLCDTEQEQIRQLQPSNASTVK